MSQRNMLGSTASIEEARGTVADLLEKLGGKEGKKWLKKQKLLLRGELQEPPSHEKEEEPIPDWEVWKTVTVGGYPSMRKFLWTRWRYRVTVTKPARTLLLSRAFDAHVYGDASLQLIDLVKVTLADLGFVARPGDSFVSIPLGEVMLRARKLGLFPCPSDSISRTLLVFKDPRGTAVRIMTLLPFKEWYGFFQIRLPWNTRDNPYPVLSVDEICDPYVSTVSQCDPDMIFWKQPRKVREQTSGGYDV